MPITRRLRFEILRRDDHACRYCGRRAPDVELTVDHVVPVALGGTDDPTNLATACVDCNSGKASTSPDERPVADVQEDALRWARAMHTARWLALVEFDDREDYRRAFVRHWETWDEKLALLPGDWTAAVDSWNEQGLPRELLVEVVDVAMSSRVPGGRVFRYACGVARRRLDRIAELARDAFDADREG